MNLQQCVDKVGVQAEELVLNVLASGEAGYITGQVFTVDGGMVM